MHVYTPPGYESGRGTFPVLYLLHGASDSDASWSTVGRAGFILDNLIAARKARPMIVVMPAGHTGRFSFGAPGSLDRQIEEFVQDFVNDLKPHVEKHYRVRADRANRAVAGLSMGGAQALEIAIPRLKDYAYVGVFSSGVFGINARRGAPAGPTWEERHKQALADAEAKKGLKLIWFATGKTDFLMDTSRATVKVLRAAGFEVTFKETEGGHTWLNWRNYLAEYAPLLFREQPERLAPTAADVPYGEHPRQKLDFWQAKSDRPTPLVVLIHGGGWVNGDKSSYGTAAIKPFLDQGISVAAINYRFIQHAMEQKVEPPVKAPLHDAARAIQLLRSKAKEWNLDKARVGATGGSAGACTSLWLAFHDDLADRKSADPVARESTRLSAAAVGGAQTSLDPKQLREWMPNAIYGGHSFGYKADGRNRAEEFALALENRDKLLPWIREYSPIELVSKDDPLVYLDYPRQDKPPVAGERQTDPTHSAVYGVKLAERCQQVGAMAIVAYPGAPKSSYASPTAFLIARLKGE
jgi:enterochelin esterase-like enzyme